MQTELSLNELWAPSKYDGAAVEDALALLVKDMGDLVSGTIHPWNK